MTLEKSKAYAGAGAPRSQALQQAADAPELRFIPHQAPQRERVSRAIAPRRAWKKKERNWKAHLREDVNLGVPQLMMLLEPNIVWDHHTAYVGSLEKGVEAQYCPNNFLHGFNRRGRTAYGVYEGSYWELLGDVQELTDILRKMAIAPALLEDPILAMPPEPNLPTWEDFKPSLVPIPTAPISVPLKLPPFKSPILATELPFIEPKLLPVPDAPEPVQEETHPEFKAPVFEDMAPFEAPEFQCPAPPAALEQPRAPVFGAPKHGLDWSGTRPFQMPTPEYQAPELHQAPEWQNPPAYLPPPPAAVEVQLEEAKLDLTPVPKLELAWVSGPQPEPAYCSLPSSPIPSPARSRASSPARTSSPSRPSSAAPSRPTSAAPSRPTSASTHAPSRPTSAHTPSRPQSARPSTPGLPPAPRSRPPSARPPSQDPPAPTTPGREQVNVHEEEEEEEEVLVEEDEGEELGEKSELQQKWEAVQDVDAGKPAMWLNFDAPFAELPPLFIPPEPKKAEAPIFVPPTNLKPLPDFIQPVEIAEPTFHAPSFQAPSWAEPREPQPIGFLRGAGPVLIMDVSGTMHPARGGRFLDVKFCVSELLGEDGEVGAAANAFDVVAFASNAWSWSAVYEGKMKMLQTSQVFHSGRQAGGKVGRPTSASPGAMQVMLQPCKADTLEDAQNWVRKWPEAVGHTNFLAALQVAAHHQYADCWYLFSDGQADDAAKTMEWLQARLASGTPTPPIHTIGFFLGDSVENSYGERFLKQISAMTGGIYQAYDPTVVRIYNPDIGRFESYDSSRDPAEVLREREWVEKKLRAERRKNLKLGISERLAVTIARVQAIHKAERVSALERSHTDHMEMMQQQHWQTVAAIKQQNATSRMAARQQWEDACEATRHFNNAMMLEAQQLHQRRLQQIEEEFESAHSAWRDHTAKLLQHRQECQEETAAAEAASRQQVTKALPSAVPGTGPVMIPGLASATPRHIPNDTVQQQEPGYGQAQPQQGPRGSAGTIVAGPSTGWQDSTGYEVQSSTVQRVVSDDESVYSDWSDDNKPAASQQQEAISLAAETSCRRLSGEAAVADEVSALQAQSSDDHQQPATQHSRSIASSTPASSRPISAAASNSSRRTNDGAGLPICAAAAGPSEGGFPEHRRSLQQLQQQLGSSTQQLLQSVGAQLSDGVLRVDAEEVKRTVLPAEVVEGVDSLNRQHLEELRSEWEAAVSATTKRNDQNHEQRLRAQRALEDYNRKVVQIFASSFASSVVKAAASEAANLQLLKLAHEAHEAAVLKVEVENRDTKEQHAQELVDRKQAEEAHTKAMLHWEAAKVQLAKEHEQSVKEALEAHREEVQRLQQLWEVQKQQLEAEHRGVLAGLQRSHAIAVAAVDDRNLKRHMAYQEATKARKAVERENAAVLAEARAQHKAQLGSLEQDNEAMLAEAQQQHQLYCQQLQQEHVQLEASLQAEHVTSVAAAQAANVEMLAEARAQLQAALLQAKAHYEATCRQAVEAHAAAEQEVQERNAEIWPQVQVARVAQAELQRVARFQEHIHFCAHKVALGVNFQPDTPNFGRVVEMAALTDALAKAFPDVDATDYPWPEHERRGEVGAGWAPAPEAKPIKFIPTGAAALKALLRPMSAQGRVGGGEGEEATRRREVNRRPQTAPSQRNRDAIPTPPPGHPSLLSAPSTARVTFTQGPPSSAPNRRPSSAHPHSPLSRPTTPTTTPSPPSQPRSRAHPTSTSPSPYSAPVPPAPSSRTNLKSPTPSTSSRNLASVKSFQSRFTTGPLPEARLPSQRSSASTSGRLPAVTSSSSGIAGSSSGIASSSARKGPARSNISQALVQSSLDRHKAKSGWGKVSAGFTKDLPRQQYPEVELLYPDR